MDSARFALTLPLNRRRRRRDTDSVLPRSSRLLRRPESLDPDRYSLPNNGPRHEYDRLIRSYYETGQEDMDAEMIGLPRDQLGSMHVEL